MRADEHETASRAISQAISEAVDNGSVAVLATLVVPSSSVEFVGAKLLVTEANKKVGSLGDHDLDHAAVVQAEKFRASRAETQMLKVEEFAPELTGLYGGAVLFERIEAEPRLVIAGAGHVGASLARLASMIGYRVTLIDDRAEFVDRELFVSENAKEIELVRAEDWAASMRESIGKGRGVSVAIVTRGHKQDEDCLRAVLTANPDYVGMIGSRRRTNIVLDKLREEGLYDELLKNVHAPIGLDIGAVSPEEVALAILAEIVAARRGGSGSPLSAWRKST
jgi:xanthine dehydrogenase accessory factor